MRLRSVCAQCGGPANPIGFKALSVSDRMRRLNMQVPVSTGPQCFLPQPSSLPLTHTHTHTHTFSLFLPTHAMLCTLSPKARKSSVALAHAGCQLFDLSCRHMRKEASKQTPWRAQLQPNWLRLPLLVKTG